MNGDDAVGTDEGYIKLAERCNSWKEERGEIERYFEMVMEELRHDLYPGREAHHSSNISDNYTEPV